VEELKQLLEIAESGELIIKWGMVQNQAILGNKAGES
jgi:hypothetical protein